MERDHFANPPQRRLGALGIVRNSSGGVLFFRRDPIKEMRRPWYHPGGCVEENEGITEGLVRAARERLGVTLEPKGLIAVHRMPDEWHSDPETGQKWLSKEGVNLLYDCGVIDFEPSDFTYGVGALEARYVMPDEFKEILPSFTMERTLAALRALEGGSVETLEGHPVS